MMQEYFSSCSNDTFLILALIAVILDTFFGVLRAIKEHSLNTSIGIDGAIRKSGMILSLFFFKFVDMLVNVNFIGFLPQEIRSYLGDSIGMLDFFALLYISYEAVSILKNMSLCGLPVRGIWLAVKKFLSKYTNEIPEDKKQEKIEEMELLPLVEELTEDIEIDAEGGEDNE